VYLLLNTSAASWRAISVALKRQQNPVAVFDLGASGGSDVARNKDAMIAEAFASRHRRLLRR